MRFTVLLAAFSGLVPIVGSQADQKPLQPGANNASLAHSPPYYPSPWMNPAATGWEEAYSKAKEFVSQLTLPEKVNLTTGVG